MEEYYMVPEELYRLGNSTEPKLTNVRTKDVDIITDSEGTQIVLANGSGISLFTKAGIQNMRSSGWVWKFDYGVNLPIGLKLVNDKPEHYCIAPVENMPLDKYKSLLEIMAGNSHKANTKIYGGIIDDTHF